MRKKLEILFLALVSSIVISLLLSRATSTASPIVDIVKSGSIPLEYNDEKYRVVMVQRSDTDPGHCGAFFYYGPSNWSELKDFAAPVEEQVALDGGTFSYIAVIVKPDQIETPEMQVSVTYQVLAALENDPYSGCEHIGLG